MSNPTGKGGFQERKHQINKKGRKTKSFDAWRNLLVELSNEPAVQRDKENCVKKLVLIQVPLVKDGYPVIDETGAPIMVEHYATNAEMIARQWLNDPKYQQQFIEGAFGKVPDEIENKNSGQIKIVVEYAKPDAENNPT